MGSCLETHPIDFTLRGITPTSLHHLLILLTAWFLGTIPDDCDPAVGFEDSPLYVLDPFDAGLPHFGVDLFERKTLPVERLEDRLSLPHRY